MPALQAIDEGIRRRIVVIPFRNTLTKDAIDRDLPEKLLEEADAILCWLVQGYYRYTVHGLKPQKRYAWSFLLSTGKAA